MKTKRGSSDVAQGRDHGQWKKIRGIIVPFLSTALFLLAVWILYREVKKLQIDEIARYFREVSLGRPFLAFAASAISYLALISYDNLALHHIGHPLGYARTAFVSYIGNAFSYTIGFSYVSGSFIRYRFYSAWGLSAAEIAKVVAFSMFSSFTGFFAVAGICFLIRPETMPSSVRLPSHLLTAVGILFVLIVGAYAVIVFFRRKPLKLMKRSFRIPSKKIFLQQMSLAVPDWVFAALTLYILLPAAVKMPLLSFISIFMTAQFIGVISFVPGGLGVFEATMLLLLPEGGAHPQLIGALLMFRIIYYLAHLGIGASMLGTYELLHLRKKS